MLCCGNIVPQDGIENLWGTKYLLKIDLIGIDYFESHAW